MRLNFILLLSLLSILSSCRKSLDNTPIAPPFVNEVSYNISRTGGTEVQSVENADIKAVYYHNVYPVLNKVGEKDILLDIQPEVPSDIDIINRFSFSFLLSVPENLFTEPVSISMGVTKLHLIHPENYTQLLLDDDDENGRRVCLTREGENPDGSIFVDNACAAEGWYGGQGDFEFEFSHHQLFFDDMNIPHIYTEGTFEATSEAISSTGDAFELRDGRFKLVIPLVLE